MKVKVQQVLNLSGSIMNYEAKVQTKIKPDGKLFYGLKKNRKLFTDVFSEIERKLEDFRIDHCSVDDKNNIVRGDNNTYKYTKAEQKALNVDIEKYLKTEIEIPEPYWLDEQSLTDDDEREAFELLIKPKEKESEPAS